MSSDGAVGTITPISRTGMVVDALRRAILSGELPAGRQLIEADLAGSFGLSKTPVREALKILAGAGLVTMSDYRGAVVRVVDEATAHSVFDVRALLEPVAVERTVANGFDVAAAEQSLAVADGAVDGTDRSIANRDFHQLLYSNSGNPLLTSMLDGLRDQVTLITITAWTIRPTWEPEAAEHAAILAAAKAGDGPAAAALVLQHIRSFEERALAELARKR
ncbi:GntR family transcriptional regulator [Streptomyces sp. ISL-90]|nr:GntR family transcriptional regulator [Streptomyces sp. ISL-90]